VLCARMMAVGRQSSGLRNIAMLMQCSTCSVKELIPASAMMFVSKKLSLVSAFTVMATYRHIDLWNIFGHPLLCTAEPSCLSGLISPYAPTCTLHSANTSLVVLPTGVTSHFSSRSFSVSSPSVWHTFVLRQSLYI